MRAISEAVEGGQWILGPQVTELEAQLATFAGVKHAIACANGTDALLLILKAWNVGPGDAVFVPSFTFAASAEVVALAGATPVFVDVLADTFNIDPASLETAIAMVRREAKLAPTIVKREGMLMLCDTAQSFGASLDGKRTGAIGDAAATSFYPAKPLGCYGDGGACFTNDDDLAEILRSLRMHGQGTDRYEHTRIGWNSRLDSIQAAVLIEKLKIFPDEIEARDRIAGRYNAGLGKSNRIRIPRVIAGARSVWAQYTIQVEDRTRLQADLKDEGIPSVIHYPIPLGRQRAYAHFPSVPAPISDALSKSVVSLPMHPYLDEAAQDRIVAAVLKSAG